MYIGFRISHVARKLEILIAVLTLGGLLTKGGKAIFKELKR